MPISPSLPGSTTLSTALSSNSAPSCVTTCTRNGIVPAFPGLEFALGECFVVTLSHVFDATGHVEHLLRDVIELTIQDHTEAAHSVLNRHIAAFTTRKALCYVHRLCQEALNLTSATNEHLVVFWQFFNTQ